MKKTILFILATGVALVGASGCSRRAPGYVPTTSPVIQTSPVPRAVPRVNTRTNTGSPRVNTRTNTGVSPSMTNYAGGKGSSPATTVSPKVNKSNKVDGRNGRNVSGTTRGMTTNNVTARP